MRLKSIVDHKKVQSIFSMQADMRSFAASQHLDKFPVGTVSSDFDKESEKERRILGVKDTNLKKNFDQPRQFYRWQ